MRIPVKSFSIGFYVILLLVICGLSFSTGYKFGSKRVKKLQQQMVQTELDEVREQLRIALADSQLKTKVIAQFKTELEKRKVKSNAAKKFLETAKKNECSDKFVSSEFVRMFSTKTKDQIYSATTSR